MCEVQNVNPCPNGNRDECGQKQCEQQKSYLAALHAGHPLS